MLERLCQAGIRWRGLCSAPTCLHTETPWPIALPTVPMQDNALPPPWLAIRAVTM
jgi:hypothetical protein